MIRPVIAKLPRRAARYKAAGRAPAARRRGSPDATAAENSPATARSETVASRGRTNRRLRFTHAADVATSPSFTPRTRCSEPSYRSPDFCANQDYMDIEEAQLSQKDRATLHIMGRVLFSPQWINPRRGVIAWTILICEVVMNNARLYRLKKLIK